MDFKNYNSRQIVSIILLLASISFGYSQSETSKWKFQIAFGFNYADVDGFAKGFEAKPVNFPTINLGLQHMFTRQLGAKADFGYSRLTNLDNTPEFKTNYTRFNAQFVYDASRKLAFLPPQMGVVAHVGPGITFTKPLGNFTENKQSFLNALGGLELHYGLGSTVTVFVDGSYIYSFAGDKTYDPVSTGFGAFTGNLFTVTAGISVSLSGCYFCN